MHEISTIYPIIMNTLSTDQLLHAHQWRFATKKFDPSKKIAASDWAVLEDVLVLSPSSFGLQPWKFIVVTNPEVREKLKVASWGQAQVTDCSHHLVITVLKELTTEYVDNYIASIASTRNQPVDSPSLQGLRNVILQFIPQRPNLDWNARQAYIALGNFMTSAAELGLDTCPMEGIDATAYDEILGLKDSPYATVVACSAGYRAADDKYATLPKVRFPKTQLIQHV